MMAAVDSSPYLQYGQLNGHAESHAPIVNKRKDGSALGTKGKNSGANTKRNNAVLAGDKSLLNTVESYLGKANETAARKQESKEANLDQAATSAMPQ